MKNKITCDQILERGTAMRNNNGNADILFIGLNPSFRKGDAQDYTNGYTLSQDTNDQYFKSFRDIAQKAGFSEWEHSDLIYIRGNHNEISICESDRIGEKVIENHLKISCNIIEKSKAKIIVVCDTKAREYFSKKYPLKWDDVIGTYIINDKNSELNNVPIFFSGMFSGQRALDLGSRRRLIWHIKYAYSRRYGLYP